MFQVASKTVFGKQLFSNFITVIPLNIYESEDKTRMDEWDKGRLLGW